MLAALVFPALLLLSLGTAAAIYWLFEHSPAPVARLGAVAFIHRFGSTLNPHLHFHCVVTALLKAA